MSYVRYESPTPNARGHHLGIFALANRLAADDRLSGPDRVWWRTNNDWFDAAYAEPGSVDPALFDRTVHPIVVCWFKATAGHLLERVPGYLDLLDRYDVAWVRRETATPGTILYSDDVQVVVAPTTTPRP